MLNYLRNIRHKEKVKKLFIWSFLGDLYRNIINFLPFNFSVKQYITENFQFKMHAFFAFSNFKNWGNKHNDFFPIYLKLSKTSKCFFDIGAHIGIVSLPLSKTIKCDGMVYSFEASPKNLYYLNYHIKINNITNIKTVNNLVSSDNNFNYSFFESNGPSGMNSIIPIEGKSIIKERKVRSITIDKFCSINKLVPDVIKVDIEGGEIDMLLGSKQVIKKYKPIIFLSFHPYHVQKIGYKKNIIFELLEEFRYRLYDSSSKETKILKNSEYVLVPRNYKIKRIFNEKV